MAEVDARPPAGFGRALKRIEDRRLLCGEGHFTADGLPPGCLHACVVRSLHAHAELAAVEAAAAMAMPGVACVLTAADLAAEGIGALPVGAAIEHRDGTRAWAPPWPVLAGDRVRYVGQPLALVVAESRAAAHDAAERVDVDYRPLPAVAEPARALAEGAPCLWPQAPGNVAFDWADGNAAACARAFAAAAHVVALDLVQNRVMAMAMEPPAAVAEPGPTAGRLTLSVPSQGVHGMRESLARVLGCGEAALRVRTGDVGGSFGVRAHPLPEHVLVLVAARRLARAVAWVADPGEAALAEPHARDHVTHAELALDAEGRFLAVRVRTQANVGAFVAYEFCRVPTAGYAAGITGAYAISHHHVAVTGAFTNTLMTTAYRGAGRPEAIYVIERLVDRAARELALAPAELRRRNLVPAMPYRTATGEVIDGGDFAGVLDDAFALADVAGFEARRRRSRPRLRGLGLSFYVKINGGTPDEAADLAIAADGRATLAIGTQSNGQGHATAYAQLVAAGLGLAPDRVTVIQGDSDRIAYGQGTGGSSALSVGGPAVVGAVDAVIAAARDRAADLLEVAKVDLVFEAGRFHVAGTDRAMTLAAVVNAAGGIDGGFHYRARARTYSNGCHVCEVEVDPETGAVTVAAYASVDDIGRVLNPMLAAGQIEGGIVQGLGQALCEHCVYDADAQLLTATTMDYALPRAADVPAFSVLFHEVACATNPLGVKGAGEAGTTGALAALVNATLDALAPLGVTTLDMPLAPERVWRAIRAAQG